METKKIALIAVGASLGLTIIGYALALFLTEEEEQFETPEID